MRIAVIGAGGAGLFTTWLLAEEHDVVLFEKEPRAGGHVHTLEVENDGKTAHVEVGARYFFDEGYDRLHALLQRLGVATRRISMSSSFSLDRGRGTLVVPPLDPRSLVTCLHPTRLFSLVGLGLFVRAAERVLAERNRDVTVRALAERSGAPREAIESVLVPLVASSWGAPRELAEEMSAFTVASVMGLRAGRLPHTHAVEGGLSAYVRALLADAPRATVRLGTPIAGLTRLPQGLRVAWNGGSEAFDAVVLAADWRSATRLCSGSDALASWAERFGAFEDYDTRVAVHLDLSLMPENRRHWRPMNFFLSRDERSRSTEWSGAEQQAPVFRTWLKPGEEAPKSTRWEAHYRHIAVTPAHWRRQSALTRLQGTHGLWAAGMYTDGVDNHESALRSAANVVRRLSPTARLRWLDRAVSA